MSLRTKVLFLCIGNACRSQMAEAIARHVASDVIEPVSAGLLPFGEVTQPTIDVLAERGMCAEGQYSKALTPQDLAAADLVINMTGCAGAAVFADPAPPVENWDVGDPFGFNLAVYRKIRDEIEAHIENLARRLREKADSQKTA